MIFWALERSQSREIWVRSWKVFLAWVMAFGGWVRLNRRDTDWDGERAWAERRLLDRDWKE